MWNSSKHFCEKENSFVIYKYKYVMYIYIYMYIFYMYKIFMEINEGN